MKQRPHRGVRRWHHERLTDISAVYGVDEREMSIKDIARGRVKLDPVTKIKV